MTDIIDVSTQVSGQIRIANTGNAVRGPNIPASGGFYIKAHPDNTDTVWVGNNGAGDVDANNGYPLNSGQQIIISVGNLTGLWFDADVSGEKICWHKA